MSRRKAEEAIAEGRVTLNGQIFTNMGQTLDPEKDALTVDGVPLLVPTEKKTYLFYKPRGIVTTKSDEKGRPTVMDFFKDEPSLNPVGRLDYESEGLLLMTHDGELLLHLTHPRYGVKKVYEVTIHGSLNSEALKALVRGVDLEDGSGRFDEITRMDGENNWRVTVSEGRNRFVRRMFSAFRCEVTRLKRTQMGEYSIGDMQPGDRIEVR